MQTEVTQRRSRGRLGRDVQSKIGQQLRAMYSDVVNQGVPDRFSEILHRLDQADEAGTDRKEQADEAGMVRKKENEGTNGPSQ